VRRFGVAVASTLAGVGLALVITAVVAWPRDQLGADREFITPPERGDDVVPPVAAPVATAIPTRPAGLADLPKRVAPLSLSIDRLGVDIPVAPYGLTPQGALDLPPNAAEAAWYRHGGVPGDTRRAALIAAHVDDDRGVGEFARLREARAGDSVLVELSDGTTHSFTITRVEQAPKAALDIPAIMNAAPGELILVTCGGRWDRSTGHYEDNVVAWASPGDQPWPATR